MNIEIIVAIIAATTAILVNILTSYFSRRNELKFAERKLKETYYLEYIKCLSNNANYNDESSIFDENKAFNNLLLIGSTNVVDGLIKFHSLRIEHIKNNNIENYIEKYEELQRELFIAIRKDLYGKKEKDFPHVYLLGGCVKNKTHYN